jgi:cation diffusion facilitator family transporter
MSTTSPVQAISHADRDKRLVALSSVIAAIFLASMKIVVGLLTGSLGILSEAAHSGLDLVAAAATFFAVRLSSRPPDRRHTYGYGKVENLSALFETLLLLVTCVWIIYEAIKRLFFKNVEVDASIWAFIVMAVSIVINYSRSRSLYRAARKYGSQALEADALHFSTDIWSSYVVIGGLFLVTLSKWLDVSWLAKADAVAALGVAGIVVYVSLQLGRKTIADLLDAIPPGVREDVIGAVQKVPGVQAVEQARIRRSGPAFFADVSVTVTRAMAFEQAHDIAAQAEEAVQSVLQGAHDVVVNVIPSASDDEDTITQVRLLAARYGLGAHSLRLYDVLGSRTLELHVEVKDTLKLEEAHALVTQFEDAVRRNLPDIAEIVTHIEPMGDAAATRQVLQAEDKQIIKAVQRIAEQSDLHCEPHDVNVHRLGNELSVSFHCLQAADTPIIDAHDITEKIERELREQVPGLRRVVIHLEPAAQGAEPAAQNEEPMTPKP